MMTVSKVDLNVCIILILLTNRSNSVIEPAGIFSCRK